MVFAYFLRANYQEVFMAKKPMGKKSGSKNGKKGC